jgi:hypothetical protein
VRWRPGVDGLGGLRSSFWPPPNAVRPGTIDTKVTTIEDLSTVDGERQAAGRTRRAAG